MRTILRTTRSRRGTMRSNRNLTVLLIWMLCTPGSAAITSPEIASVVHPCQGVMIGSRQIGDDAWVKQCAQAYRGGDDDKAAIHQCRQFLERCQRNPNFPWPSL